MVLSGVLGGIGGVVGYKVQTPVINFSMSKYRSSEGVSYLTASKYAFQTGSSFNGTTSAGVSFAGDKIFNGEEK